MITEVTSGWHRLLRWRPLIRRLREPFWNPVEAPYLLLGLDPDLSEGDRHHEQGWHLAWLTKEPVGRYATFAGSSLELNLAHDLHVLGVSLSSGTPTSFSPQNWINWACERGQQPPWLDESAGADLQRRIFSGGKRSPRPAEKADSHFARGGRERQRRTKFPRLKVEVRREWSARSGWEKHGRKEQFDRDIAGKFDLEIRTVARWRREWQRKQTPNSS